MKKMIATQNPFGRIGTAKEISKHLKSANMVEWLNEELARRTHVIRIFPNEKALCDSSGL
jgi:transposase-like protein